MKTRLVLIAAALLLLAGGAIALTHIVNSRPEPAAPESSTTALTSDDRVVLSGSKVSSLGIRVEPARVRLLQETHVVPGRIQYNSRKRVDIPAVVAGIAIDVRVAPGDRVAQGQVLAILSSPEIAAARVDVHRAHERWELARRKADWEKEIAQNVAALIDDVKSGVTIIDAEKRFKNKTLGKSRDVLLSAYSRFLLSEKLAKTFSETGTSTLPAITIQQREAERRSARAALLAACEQASFDVSQEQRSAQIEAGDGERQFHIAQEQLRTLLGYWPDPAPQGATEGDVLSRIEIRAPFSGTIEEKRVAPAARLQKLETMFVLADASTLWVVAELREQDWRALALIPGQQLAVQSPALPGRRLLARLDRIGRQVDRESNSVALVAEIANADGLLRPGLFVQVSIPIGTAKEVLSVPATAITAHENSKFVFQQDNPTTFRRVDVTTGAQDDHWVEIVAGIAPGTPIVVQGATALKAEMLLPKMNED